MEKRLGSTLSRSFLVTVGKIVLEEEELEEDCESSGKCIIEGRFLVNLSDIKTVERESSLVAKQCLLRKPSAVTRGAWDRDFMRSLKDLVATEGRSGDRNWSSYPNKDESREIKDSASWQIIEVRRKRVACHPAC